jgi:hypothetical protein
MVMVAVRGRPVAHSQPVNETSDEGERVKDVDFQVELTSIAQLTPAWDAGGVPEAAIRAAGAENREAYAGVVGVRTDTLTFSVRDYGTSPKRWAICGVTGKFRGASSEFWLLARRELDWLRVVRWTPADASWGRVSALADSVARTTR